MLKKISIIIASILLVGAIIASPHIYNQVQFSNGNMLKIVDAHAVYPTDQGGFAKYFTVQNNNGNTYDIYTGFIAQWDKSEGDYINIKYVKTF